MKPTFPGSMTRVIAERLCFAAALLKGESMPRPLSILGVALFVAALPSLLDASSIQKLKNEKVSVTEDTLVPGESESLSSSRPGMIVYLSGGSVAVESRNGKTAKDLVKRGNTVFEPAGTKSLKNAGSSNLSFVRIEFLTDGKQETLGHDWFAPELQNPCREPLCSCL
jgi:hypothetical protein